jgi:hypothetical protein
MGNFNEGLFFNEQVHGPCALRTEVELLSMTLRQSLGDLGFAILLALPLAALARTVPAPHPKSFPAASQLASADRSGGSDRIGLLG